MFKIGNKVRILGSDTWNQLARKYIGLTAIVTRMSGSDVIKIEVIEDGHVWYISNNNDIETLPKKEIQLEFDFMIEDEND